MTFKLPTVEELMEIGSDLGFPVDSDYAADLLQGMVRYAAGYQALDAETDELPPVRYPQRSHRIPDAEENPLAAWYVKTSIKGAEGGPLAGCSVAIKDNIFVADVPMMNGASVLEGFVPDFDATAVTRLLDAGADIAGKAVCEYLCMAGGSFTSSSGMVCNPRNPGYSAGGSSSGSAALVAAGEVDLSLGCDQAGSVRIPASWCGVYGMKATHGLVPYTGIMSLETSVDHVGPITNKVSDNALMLEVLAGYDGLDGRQQNLTLNRYTQSLDKGIRGMKIGVVREGFGRSNSEAAVDECVRAAVAELGRLGATLEEVSIPAHLAGVAIWGGIVTDGIWQTSKLNALGCNHNGVYSPALFAAADKLVNRLDEMPQNVRLVMLLGKYLERYNGQYYCKAKNLSRRLRAAYDSALERYDLLAMPTVPHKAAAIPKSQAEAASPEMLDYVAGNIRNTCQFSVTGHPSMSVPCGLVGGLPVGLMLTGRHFDEPTIYRAAYAFEQGVNWENL